MEATTEPDEAISNLQNISASLQALMDPERPVLRADALQVSVEAEAVPGLHGSCVMHPQPPHGDSSHASNWLHQSMQL